MVEGKLHIISEYIIKEAQVEKAVIIFRQNTQINIPTHVTILRIYNQFKTTGCMNTQHIIHKKRRKPVVTKDFKQSVCLVVEKKAFSSFTKLSNDFCTSRSSCYKTLEKF